MSPGGRRQRRPLTLAEVAQALHTYEHACSRPSVTSGLVDRDRLVRQVTGRCDVTLAVVTGPAGSGKTTLALQLVAHDSRPVAWVTVDEHTCSPQTLLRHIAVAVHAVTPLPDQALASLQGGGRGWETSALPLVLSAVRRADGLVLVIDDVHHLHATAADLLEILVAGWPAGSLLVLASRSQPRLGLGRLQLSGRVARVDASDLSFSSAEAASLASLLELELTAETVERLVGRTEGWAAALRLEMLALRDGSRDGSAASDPDHPLRSTLDYLQEELLDRQPGDVARFLVRTSILDVLSGPLCDAVLAAEGSARALAAMSEDGALPLVAVDSGRAWFRVHPLFRELLVTELERREPEVVPVLRARASRWFEADGDHDRAILHAVRAGDRPRAADLVFQHVVEVGTGGRNDALGRWLGWFTRAECERSAPLALSQAWFALGEGRPDDVEEWIAHAAAAPHAGRLSDGTPSVELATSIMQTLVGSGAGAALLSALDGLQPSDARTSPLCAIGVVLQGTILWMMGDDEAAVAGFRASEPGWIGVPVLRAAVLAYLALIAAERGDGVLASSLERRANGAIEEHHLFDHPMVANPLLALALVEARSGAKRLAEDRIVNARRLLGGFGHLAPRSRLLSCSLLAELHLCLDQLDGAKTVLAEAEPLARRESWATGLVERLDRSRAELARRARVTTALAEPGPASLTPAELRILAYLPTHLSLREIGERVVRSTHTVKSQTVSVYRKLGASSRSDAVERARELGLLD